MRCLICVVEDFVDKIVLDTCRDRKIVVEAVDQTYKTLFPYYSYFLERITLCSFG